MAECIPETADLHDTSKNILSQGTWRMEYKEMLFHKEYFIQQLYA